MNAWIEALNGLSATWFDLIVRASYQGGIALAAVWLISRFISRIPPAYKVWLWRLAFLKLVLALVWLTPVALPVLPPESQNVLIAEPVPPVASIAEETAFAELSAPQTIAPTPQLNWRAWLLITWCVGLFCGATRLARHGVQARRLLAHARLLRKSNLEELAKRLTKRFGLRRTPILMESSVISSPILLGILRQRVILPDNMSDSASQSCLELMLAHELAHCSRKDLLWLWLFALAEALFFFHPLVWLARREWTLATEAACDQMAIRFTRQTPGDYGEMLVDIVAATSRCANATPLVAVGIIENAHTLKRRLKLMITTRTRFASVGGIVLITIASLTVVPWKLTAQEADPEAVAKLKEENAKLRQELEAMRRDAEKMRVDAEQMRKRALDEREDRPLNERPREEELRRVLARDALEFDRQRKALEFDRRKAEYQKAKVQLANAERVAKRNAQLRADNLVSSEIVDEGVARFNEAKAALLAAEAARNAAKLEFEHTEIRPIDGRQARGTLEDPLAPRRDTAAMKERAMKRLEQQRALLQKEIELAERHFEFVRKNLENGKEVPASELAAQRELLDVKLQLARLSNSKADERAVLLEQLNVAEKMLKEYKMRVDVGTISPGAEIPFEREVLRIRRQLSELEDSDARE